MRISGPLTTEIAAQITQLELRARFAHHTAFVDANGAAIDVGVALLFKAPHSYTGDDVLELQGHGGPVVLDMLLQRVIALGARMARPGEFSERAFLNNKLDLAQAEAVADLIDSGSQAAAMAAVRSLSGSFSASVTDIQQELTALRVWLEAALDFSEDDIDFFAEPVLAERTNKLVKRFDTLMAKAEQGQRLRDGYTVVIAGVTNVGKSSLLNVLSGADSAIVTDIEGTTRDVLRENINIEGVPFEFIDTAGLRETSDTVEQEGIERARRAIDSADHILIVADANNTVFPDVNIKEGVGVTLLLNKTDLLTADTLQFDSLRRQAASDCISALHCHPDSVLLTAIKHGNGVNELKRHLLKLVGHNAQVDGAFSARRRHLLALAQAREACDAALLRLKDNTMPELAAEELRLAQQHLDAVTGRFDSEDLLGEIFSSFCIGK